MTVNIDGWRNARTRPRWYVTAKTGHETNYLCGPFLTAHAAIDMIAPVQRACERKADPRFRTASYGFERKAGKTPPGSLDLALIDPADVLGVVSWAAVFAGYRRTEHGSFVADNNA